MRRTGLALGGVCTACALLSSSAVQAQDGGILLTFGIENRLEIVRNDDLSVPSSGTDVANVTVLSFGLISETAIDRLAFAASGAMIVENTADSSGTELDFGRAEVTLDYHREVPAAVLDLAAEFRNDDVDAFDDLEEDDETGTRTDLGVSARLETGRTSSIGFAMGAAYETTDYQDTADPDLVDTTETRADIAVLLHATETTTGRLGLRYRHREEDTAGDYRLDERTAYAGLDYAVSERLDLAAEIGYVTSEIEEFGILEEEDGPELSLGLTYDMPVGIATALFRVTTDADEGQRETFEIGRELETPANVISARLGITHADTTGTDMIGSLRLDHPLPDGSIGISLERSVGFDDDDDEEVVTSLARVAWAKSINDFSAISLDISYELSDSPTERIEQVTFGAGYSHRLTDAWTLDSGIGYRVRHDADGHSESPNLFVALSRDFQFRP